MITVGGARLEIALTNDQLRLSQAAMINHIQQPIVRMYDEHGAEVPLPESLTMLIVNATIVQERRSHANRSSD